MKIRIIKKLPAGIIAIAIFYLSSLPGNDVILKTFDFNDKFQHFIAYLVLGISCCLWLSNQRWCLKPVFCIMFIGILCSVFGVINEWLQSFVPGRFGNDLGDMIANLAGSFASTIIYVIIIKFIVAKKQQTTL